MRNSPPTMKDVAREAGVALGTVSKVMNNLPVGESYRIRVEEAAQRLGYQVNQYARGLKTNRTNITAVILPDLHLPFFAMLAQELQAALAARNNRMLLFLTGSSREREQECIRLVRQNKADGIIGLTYSNLEPGEGLPFVSIDRYFGPKIPCVASDNYGGGRIAAERLVQLGCRNLLFVRTGSTIPGEADKRGDGFLTTCNLMNVPCTALRLNEVTDMTVFRDFFQEHLHDGKLDFDGIFCSTDHLACNIRRILRALGLRVPEDVQIIGFDGIVRFDGSGYHCSTIVQPADKIAQTCVDVLFREDRENVPSLICLPVSYAPGGTTKE